MKSSLFIWFSIYSLRFTIRNISKPILHFEREGKLLQTVFAMQGIRFYLSLQPKTNAIMRVKNVEHLKELASNAQGDMVDFYIVLAGGLARSCKRIHYSLEFDEFDIVHEIDESFQELPADQLGTQTNLLEAIEKGALFRG